MRDDAARGGPTAFSLIELLVVMGVIAVLAALIAPAFQTIGSANALTSSGATVVGNFVTARNLALSRTESLELRFIELPEADGERLAYRALQLYRMDPPEPIGPVAQLPTGMIIVGGGGEGGTYSTITSSANPNSGDMQVRGVTRKYRAVRFRPNGSTTLNAVGAGNGSDRWFLSLKQENAPPGDGRPATNFITVVVDPITGLATSYRP